MTVYNSFNFDSNMEDAFTHQIGLKTNFEMEKKSIWDLDLGEEDVKSS